MHVKQRMVNDKSKEQLRRECTDVTYTLSMLQLFIHSFQLLLVSHCRRTKHQTLGVKRIVFCNGDSVGQVFLVQNESTKAIAHSA